MRSDNSKIKRTIESALDLNTGKEINANDFFNKERSVLFKLRFECETAIREKVPRYVCYFCRQPLKIRGTPESKMIFHFAHLWDSDECPSKTNSKFTIEEICCIKYNGVKESNLHLELKAAIATALEYNHKSLNGVDSIDVEKVFKHKTIPKTWKKPDVSCTYKGMKVVFELQLSTTFLSVINSRHGFYKENETYILWVFNNFEKDDDKRLFTQSDVFYNNNRNGFIIDSDAISKSFEKSDLVLKCCYQKPYLKHNRILYEWIEEYVTLNQLTFNQNLYSVHFFDVDGTESNLKIELEIRNSRLLRLLTDGDIIQISQLFIENYTVGEFEKREIVKLYNEKVKNLAVIDSNSNEYRIIWATILMKINDAVLINDFLNDYKLERTVLDVLSLKLDKIIGYGFQKQIQISHQLLATRPQYMDLYLRGIKCYRPKLLQEQDKSHKLFAKIQKLKESNTIQEKHHEIISVLFPDLPRV